VPGANRLQVAYAGYRPDGLYTQQGSFTLGAWYHVVCAFNTTSLDVYINGVPQAGLTNSGGVNFGGSPNLRLASRGDGIQKLNGQLDEVRISSSKRSPAWIAANYKAQTATFVAFGAAEGTGGGEEAAAPTAGLFRRGDLNRDGAVDLSDGVALLHHLYSGGAGPICPDAADANDDGAIDVADPITILGFLFQGGAAPPAPGVRDCGIDPTEDFLADCAASDC
jgi:hypothetical protein